MLPSDRAWNDWVWSHEHGDYYRCQRNHDGGWNYVWARSMISKPCAQDERSRGEETPGEEHRTSYVALKEPTIMNQQPLTGMPNHGSYEALDPSYRMRTRGEAHEFFTKGRVFAMLWAEAASETVVFNKIGGEGTVQAFNSSITPGRFGESVYSQIRRFVIIDVRRKDHLVKTCPITTYTNRVVVNHGFNAREHTIVYFNGTQPAWYQGECEMGMTKDHLMIVPADEDVNMSATSRLYSGRTYPIEWNVKAKNKGIVYRGEKAVGSSEHVFLSEVEAANQTNSFPRFMFCTVGEGSNARDLATRLNIQNSSLVEGNGMAASDCTYSTTLSEEDSVFSIQSESILAVGTEPSQDDHCSLGTTFLRGVWSQSVVENLPTHAHGSSRAETREVLQEMVGTGDMHLREHLQSRRGCGGPKSSSVCPTLFHAEQVFFADHQIPDHNDFMADPAHHYWAWDEKDENWWHKDERTDTIVWAPLDFD